MANSINAIGSRGREYLLSVGDIHVDETYNIRQEYGSIDGEDLATIETEGVKQSLIGFMRNGQFVVCDGFRRMRKVAWLIETGKKLESDFERKIPCKIDQSCETQEGRTLLALEMSSARPLSMLEQGYGFKQLKDLTEEYTDEKGEIKVRPKYTLQTIADHPQVRKSRQHVIDCIALVESPVEVQALLSSALLTIAPTEVLRVVRLPEFKGQPELAVEAILDGQRYAESLIENSEDNDDANEDAPQAKTKVTRKHIEAAKSQSQTKTHETQSDTVPSTYDDEIEKKELAAFLATMDEDDWMSIDISVMRKIAKKMTSK